MLFACSSCFTRRAALTNGNPGPTAQPPASCALCPTVCRFFHIYPRRVSYKRHLRSLSGHPLRKHLLALRIIYPHPCSSTSAITSTLPCAGLGCNRTVPSGTSAHTPRAPALEGLIPISSLHTPHLHHSFTQSSSTVFLQLYHEMWNNCRTIADQVTRKIRPISAYALGEGRSPHCAFSACTVLVMVTPLRGDL